MSEKPPFPTGVTVVRGRRAAEPRSVGRRKMLRIRDYDPSRDSHFLRACFVDLQDFERRLDLRIPPGEQVADSYLDLMFQRCREFEGVVLVADVDRVMVGFVTILTRYCSSEPDDDPRAHGFVTDLVVLAAHRGAMSEMWPAVL